MASLKNESIYSNKTAIVIGGSIAGKLAAKVLSDFFEKVIIVEKDTERHKENTRIGVPQGAHGHALLKSGEEALSELFPGIVDELIADGSVKTEFAGELAWYHHGNWKTKYNSGLTIVQQSRPFLEYHIGRRLALISNIHCHFGFKVKDLLMNKENSKVVGIEVEKEGKRTEFEADFVVDATGAGSNTPNLLKKLGFEAPEKTEVKVDLFYSSRIYRSLSSFDKKWVNLLVYPNPPAQTRGGGISPIEGNRWMVTLLGYGVQSPPSNEKQFLEYAKSLDKPDVYNAIKEGDPLTDVEVYRFPALRRYHYEKLRNLPNGLLVLGDAFCRVDPVFAQGMTIAALEALTLKKELQKAGHLNEICPLSLHKKISKIIDIPWLIALTEDFRFSHTRGSKPFGLSILKWYVKKVILACSADKNVYHQFIRVLHLKAHPVSLFSPLILKSVLLPKRK